MELAFAFLANAAGVAHDGRLWIAGADFDTLVCAGVPITAQFNLIVKLTVEPQEIGLDHYISLSVVAPDGNRTILRERDPIQTAPNQFDQTLRSSATIVALIGMGFTTVGEYRLHVNVDGRDVKVIPLNIRVDQVFPGIPQVNA